ncbi:MAG: prolyl oligopeptidase family serine peptidase [Verrucomicrobiae bacterium]|nr:prolyl oligopeptidase family serine peptidase [Verrucomicrobiae bacterium]
MARCNPLLLLQAAVVALLGCRSLPPVGQTPQQLDNKLAYWLYLPDDYYSKPRQRWPLLLFLHGAGERGTNLTLVLKHGPPKLAHEGRKFPFIIVSPQCPTNQWWSPTELTRLLDHLTRRYRVDNERVYLTGLSMGGYGTWALAAAHPERFAAIAPICGGGDTTSAHRLRELPIWVFHGAKDKTVPVEKSIQMVEAIKAAGGNVRLTIYPDVAHDSWTQTYENPEFYDWLLSHRRRPIRR